MRLNSRPPPSSAGSQEACLKYESRELFCLPLLVTVSDRNVWEKERERKNERQRDREEKRERDEQLNERGREAH